MLPTPKWYEWPWGPTICFQHLARWGNTVATAMTKVNHALPAVAAEELLIVLSKAALALASFTKERQITDVLHSSSNKPSSAIFSLLLKFDSYEFNFFFFVL